MKRRGYLALAGSVAFAGCSESGDQPDNATASTPGTGTRTVAATPTTTRTPTLVETRDGLVAALMAAGDGDEIVVDPAATIDLSGLWNVTVPAGVTLRGGREQEGVEGALLYSPPGDEAPQDMESFEKFRLEEDARFVGFRLRGHHHEYVNPAVKYDGNYYAHRGDGVRAGRNAEVAHNEISGWVLASVLASDNAHVHHNFIHHNTWEGLGYGVVVPAGDHMPIIEYNRFNYNRHSIAGAGGPRVGYVARYNVVGDEWVGHQFDMHGSQGMSGVAGDRIVIHHNTFRGTRVVEAKTRPPDGVYPAIKIRGTPTKGVWVEYNWFYHDSQEAAYEQTGGPTRAHFAGNHYGRSEPAQSDVGATWATDGRTRGGEVGPPGGHSRRSS